MDGMTVGELRRELEFLDDDKVIVFAYGSGDHWGRVVAEEISDIEECGYVTWSDYHGKYKIIDVNDCMCDDECSCLEEATEVVILG